MEAERVDLARRVIATLANGQPVPVLEALQLRNWALRPEDSLLSLKEIARRILVEEDAPRSTNNK
jgi:hypothetical protein